MAKSAVRASHHPSFIAERVRDYRYFFLKLAPSPRSELTVACGGWERCSTDYEIHRSDFAFFGIEYVAQGRGTIVLNGKESRLFPGSVFAYRPFAAHRIQTDPRDPLVKHFIDFSGRDAGRLISTKVFGTDGLACLHDAQPVHEIYEYILETGLKGGRVAPRLCAALLEFVSPDAFSHHPLRFGAG